MGVAGQAGVSGGKGDCHQAFCGKEEYENKAYVEVKGQLSQLGSRLPSRASQGPNSGGRNHCDSNT